MLIGQVSQSTGLTTKAIRLYEEKGLIQPPARRGRYRVYSEEDLDVLQLIVEAKSLGVTLAQLKGVITYRDGEVDWQKVHQFLLEVKKNLQIELDRVLKNIEKIDNCIDSMDSCPKSR